MTTPMTKTRRTDTPWRQSWQRLLDVTGHRGSRLKASLMGLIIAAALQGGMLACILPLFSALLHQNNAGAVLFWFCIMGVLMLMSTALRWWAQKFDYDGEMTATTHEIRTRLGEQLRRIPLETLQNKRAGEVNALLLGSVDETLSYTLTVANLIATALITPLTVALITAIFDWCLGLLLLLIFPVLVPLRRWLRPFYGNSMRTLALAHQQTNADIVEYVQGLPVLRAACCEGEKALRLQNSFRQLQQHQEQAQRQSALPHIIMTSTIEIGILLTLYAGVALTVSGISDLTVLAAVLVLTARFSEPLATLIVYTKVLDLMEAALEHIRAMLAIKPLPQRQPAQQPDGFAVCFNQVTFRYSSADRPILNGINAQFPARSLTALVGPSGSGKTTLTRLIMRHADPQSGEVTIGGADVRTMTQKHLSRLIAVVFQDVYLFDDSIIANIRMARPQASDAEVEEAARAANCHDFIRRLPDGYATRVGDIGGRLSGGERQRISIARAILKDAPIVILDEPSAALDTESEVAVQRAIERLVQDKTVIVIAHRLSTTVSADRILVVDNGVIVEQGSHEELLEENGRYLALWQAQQSTKSWHVAN